MGNLRTTSTNKLTLAALKLAHVITLSIVNRVYAYSVQPIDQFSSLKARPFSRFLWLLIGSGIVGSFIWLMQLIPLDGWSFQLAGLSLTVLVVLLAPALFGRKRVANTKGKSVASPDELALDAELESSKRLQKQSEILIALTQLQTLGHRDFQTVVEQITAGAADALEVGRVSLWLYNKHRSQLECLAVYEQSSELHSSRNEVEEELGSMNHPPRPSLPTRPLTPSPHHAKPVAVANRLDAPILFHEKVIGVVCYEHLTPTASQWTHQDETFAGAIANLVALTLQAGNHQPVEVEIPSANRDRILESIPEAFFVVDREWKFTYINSKTEQFLSQTAEQLLGKSVWDEFPHALGSQLEQQFRQAVAEQISVKFEEFYRPLQSWLEVRAYPYEDGLSVYFSDITPQKQTQTERLERMHQVNTSLTHLSMLAAEVGVVLAKGGSLFSILQHCTDAIAQQMNASSATIWTFNPASQQLEQQVSSGQYVPVNLNFINLVAQTRQPYWTSEERAGERESGRVGCNHRRENSNRSIHDPEQTFTPGLRPAALSPPPHFSGYPLVVEDRVMGVLAVMGEQPLSEDIRDILSWVANAIAVAIDRYWARSELLTRRESLLFGLANQIRNSLELDTILETAVQSIRSLFQIDRCHFLWYRPHETEPYWEIVHEARSPNLPSHIGRYTTAQVRLSADRLLNRQIIQVDQVKAFPNPRLRKFLLKMGYTSVLSIPIRTPGGALGILSCGHCTGLHPWQESEVELLQAVVAQLAIALDQAELYAQARQAAAEAQAKAQELERTLHQLSTTQSRLVQSEKMSSLGQLVAGVAHEINNPINFIHGNLAYAGAYIYDVLNLLRLYQEHYPHPDPAIAEQAELINIDFIAADLPKLLGSMQRGTDRIRSIVQSLRKFSRADEADMKRVDVHEGIESTLLILQHRLTAKGKQPEIIIYKDYGNLPLIECYPGELNQVFMNILINAIEALKPSDIGIQEHASLFVPHPSPAITIRTRLLEHYEVRNTSTNLLPAAIENSPSIRPVTEILTRHNCQRVVIQIADNGPGMSDSVKHRLFDPFFTTKPVGQGCGLGLSISYQIVVEHHHGILTCTSAPGKGTEFWIEIPIQQVL